MLPRKVLKTGLTALAFVLLGAALLLLVLGGKARRGKTLCSGLQVELTDDFSFTSKADAEAFIKEGYGVYIGKRLDSLDLGKIEKALEAKGEILSAQAYCTPDGSLNLKISQRRPVLLLRLGGKAFYCDASGFLFPYKEGFKEPVPLLEGNAPLRLAKGLPKRESEAVWLRGVLELLRLLEESKTWKGFFPKLLAGSDGKLTLLPFEGPERFILGQPRSLERKLRRLELYYTSVKPSSPEACKTVDLSFEGQIVCRR